MRYYNFLNENRTQEITDQYFNSLLERNCSYFLSKKFKIYRGMKKNILFGYIDPTKSIRKSRYSLNYYTIMFDEILPSWEGWPKRSKSIICSTSLSYAHGYGNIYEIYPYDNNRIGICSENDIWDSFKRSFFQNLNAFSETLQNISRIFNHNLKENKESLIQLFEILDSYGLDEILDKLRNNRESVGVRLLKDKDKDKTTLEHFDKMFNPISNGFNNYTTLTYKHQNNKEVWIEGPCLLKNVTG